MMIRVRIYGWHNVLPMHVKQYGWFDGFISACFCGEVCCARLDDVIYGETEIFCGKRIFLLWKSI